MENCAKVVCENCCVKRSRAAGGELKRMRNLIIFVSFMFTLLTRQHFLASESCVLRSPLGIFTVGLSSSFLVKREEGNYCCAKKYLIFFSFSPKHSSAQARYSLSCIKIELRGLAIRIIIVFFSAQNSEWLMITCRQLLSIVSGLFRLLDFYKIHFLECWREEGENWEWEISRFRDVSRAEYTAWLEKVRRWRRE